MAYVTGQQQTIASINRYIEQKLASAILLSDQFGKSELERYAKMNARWTDQTSRARNGLFSKSYFNRSTGKIHTFIAHNVEYGIHLEKNNAGRYAILEETIYQNKEKYLKQIKRLLR